MSTTRRLSRAAKKPPVAQLTISDTFTRADASTLGVAETGQAWTAVAGTWQVAGGAAVPATTGIDAYACVETGMADVSVSADVYGIGADKWPGIMARFTDVNNQYSLEINSSNNQLIVQRRYGGTATEFDRLVITNPVNLRLDVHDVTGGTELIAYINAAEVGRYTDTAPRLSGTKAGIRCGNFSAELPSFDNFKASPYDSTSQPPVVAATALSFTGATIPLSDPEIPNPSRGMHRWLGIDADPSWWPITDTYYRRDYFWQTLEPSQGSYSWTQLDADLAEAAARTSGGRLGFRIMAWYDVGGPRMVPDYVPVQDANYQPDWNSEIFLTAWENLWTAIGTRYKNDKRLFHVDIGGYGASGEWIDPPTGTLVTESNGYRIIRAVIDNLPNHWVTGPAFSPWIDYAMNYSPRVGHRYDWLGGQELAYNNWAVVGTRWQTAPCVAEWGNNIAPANTIVGQHNVQDLHFSMISSGNHPWTYASLTAQQKSEYEMANKLAGYRLSLTSVSLPKMYHGTTAACTLVFDNAGVAPTYDNWRTELVFTPTGGGTSVYLDSTIDIRTVLPGSKTFTPMCAIPATLSGSYDVALRCVDPGGYLPPLRLATTGQTAEGLCPLGTVIIG